MRYPADIMRAWSLRLLLFTAVTLLLYPLLGQLILLLSGAADPHPYFSFYLLLLLAIILVELSLRARKKQLRRSFLDRPLVSHSWPDVRLLLQRFDRRLDSALFLPWQAAGMRDQLYPRCLQAAGRADEADLQLLQLLEHLLHHDDPAVSSRAGELFHNHFADATEVHPAALPGLLHLYSLDPDKLASLTPAIQKTLLDNASLRNRLSFDFMQDHPHQDFFGVLTRIYARLHDAPVSDSAFLQELLNSPDCRRGFKRVTRRKLRRLSRPNEAQQGILDQLEEELHAPVMAQLGSGLRPVAALLRHSAFIYTAGGIVVVLLLFKLGSWLFTGEEPVRVEPLLLGVSDSAAYTVQVMATRDSAAAIEAAGRLIDAGYYSYVLSPRVNSAYFRVRTGLLSTRSEADTLAVQLLGNRLIEEFYVAPFDSTGLILPGQE